MNMEITVAENKKLIGYFIIGRYNQNWYIFNKIQFLINISSDVR